MTSRRDFLRNGGVLLAGAALQQGSTRPTQPDSQAAAPDTLVDPAGRLAAPVGPLDNDPGVIAIERRLHCTCGCTLDVYTCRTTDFSCTYSPAMHRSVVAQVKDGVTPDRIVQSFVDQYGPTVLMAPPPRGFNLAGYLIPGVSVAAVAAVLVVWLQRRHPTVAVAPTIPGAARSHPDSADLERLQRALDDVES